MKRLSLTQGKFALVDDADFESVCEFKWCAHRTGNRWYAVRGINSRGGKGSIQRLHSFLMPGISEIDHKDGNGLNNQRENLRPVTRSQNSQAFRRKIVGASSKFRGVYWSTSRQKWVAQIHKSNTHLHLGYFELEIDAARAYDAAAIKLFGEFASPNFKPKQNQT